MPDKGGEDIVPKGNEWELVALTESTFAAAPAPNQETADSTNGNFIGDDNSETGAMFMSAHFGVPSKTPENLPVDCEEKSKPDQAGFQSNLHEGQIGGKVGQKDVETLQIEQLISDDFPVSPKLSGKSDILSLYSSGFGTADSPDIMEKGQMIYEETEVSGLPEMLDSPENAPAPATSNPQKLTEGDKVPELPPNPTSDIWWRRHAIPFYEIVKTADPFWSVLVAATIVGLVIFGRRWRQDKPEALQVKSRLVINDEGSSVILFPMSHLKEARWDNQHAPHLKFASLGDH